MASSSAALAALALATAAVLAAGCGSRAPSGDPGLGELALDTVAPSAIVPGSTVVVDGRSFVAAEWGASRLRLRGDLDGAPVDVALPLEFVDFDRMQLVADDLFFAAFPAGEGAFTGDAEIEVDSLVDGETYRSEAIEVSLSLHQELSPSLDLAASGELIFVNDDIEIEGAGFLLGGGEGRTVALLEGCFTPTGAVECTPISAIDIPVEPDSAFDRSRGHFAFRPGVAGIEPGVFTGSLRLRNAHADGAALESDALEVDYELIEPAIFEVTPPAASLGQYVDVDGGGFLGGDGGGVSLLSLSGSFTPDGGDPVEVDLVLVPEFVDGRLVRYVMSEDDELGQAIDLRQTTGAFEGTVAVESRWEDQTVVSLPVPLSLRVAPVKQVVHLVFRPGYVESLRHYGLRALDPRLRERIVAVVARDYAGINLEVRLEPPEDFAVYSTVEVNGEDPNGLGLIGLDNSPGKDTGNQRLFDNIGGVNAQTQQDGFPGYGGVFIESLFAFSEHPGGFADSLGDLDGSFDDVFDPFRPDRDGDPVRSADLAGGVVEITSGASCPADDREGRIACALWVLGNLIGTTLSHEIGHSLGLANPFDTGFHNPSDGENRLMDSGGARPFGERAELFGEGPGRFCNSAYDYLRNILPTDAPSDSADRPDCF